jgi:TolA-binding protein
VRWYREYLAGFNDSPKAPGTRLLLADLLFDNQRYVEAAGEYEQAAYSYKSNPEAARAGYAALVSYDKAAPGLPEPERVAWQQRMTESSIRFADTFPAHPEVAAVLTRTTRTLFDNGDRERAESVAQRVLALGARATPDQQRVAWTVLASTYFDSARYADAEVAYRELVARIPPGDPERSAVVERLAASVYRQGEAKQAAGDIAGAVDQFLRVAQVAPDSSIRPAAEFDAATLLVNASQWDRAATVLEAFRRDHPNHALVPEATRKLAVAYMQTGRNAQAAVELERVAAREGEDLEVRRESLWQAAELYSQANDSVSATRAYADYVQRYPHRSMLRSRRATSSPTSQTRRMTMRRASAGSNEIVKADAAGGTSRTDRSRLLAARASLELARPRDDMARAIKLTVPLDRGLAREEGGDGTGAERLRTGCAVRHRGSVDASDLCDGRAVPSPRQGVARIGTTARVIARRARAVPGAARGAGVSVRRESYRDPRIERAARRGRHLRRLGPQELHRSRGSEARTVRAQRARPRIDTGGRACTIGHGRARAERAGAGADGRDSAGGRSSNLRVRGPR